MRPSEAGGAGIGRPAGRPFRGHCCMGDLPMADLIRYFASVSEAENRRFADTFKVTFLSFAAIAVISHLLVLAWKP
jgi:hypothetical protein